MNFADSPFNTLWRKPVSWLAAAADGDDIAISSRIRLARNLNGFPFPVVASEEQLFQVREQLENAVRQTGVFGSDMWSFPLSALSEVERQLLFERRLVSRELLERGVQGGLCFRADETASAIFNEEDHLRLQTLLPGLQLNEAWRLIDQLDSRLGEVLSCAFDSRLGYLSCCPTNAGTGMRASVMLHLPGLVASGQIGVIVQGISKLGMAVRGIFGEGTDNRGNLFQISNQSTLGESEVQIIERLSDVIQRLIAHEKQARNAMLEKNQSHLLDKIGRAYGVLQHAYVLNYDEALRLLSQLRLGVDLSMFSQLTVRCVNELFMQTAPAHLQFSAGRELTSTESGIIRAALVRERLARAKQEE